MKKRRFHCRKFDKVYSPGPTTYYYNMSQLYDISPSTFIVPSQASIPATAYTSRTTEFDLFIKQNLSSTLAKRGLVIKPRRVKRGALMEFKRTLLMSFPTMRDRTHEEIERLIDERNVDALENM